MHYNIISETNRRVPRKKIEMLMKLIEEDEEPPDSCVNIIFVRDSQIKKLNTNYRKINKPTDVLSFPSGGDMADGEPYLGDIIVAFPYTAAQAEADSLRLEDVLVLLAVHGALHLLGYDHDTMDNQLEMWDVQKIVMEPLGASLDVMPPLYDFPPEDDLT